MQAIRGLITAVFVIIAVSGYSQVPDNLTFDLDTVVDVVNPSSNDLIQCFSDANADLFDALYEEDKNELDDFRNYGDTISYEITYATPSQDYENGIIENSGSSDFNTWEDICTSVSGVNTSNIYVYRVLASHDGNVYEVNRSFVTFDLTHIPSGANLEDVSFQFKMVSKLNSAFLHSFYIVKGTQGLSLTTDDFDQLDRSVVLASDGGNYMGGTYMYQKQGNTHSYIEDNLGSFLKVVIIHTYDQNYFASSPNNEKSYFELFKEGEGDLRYDFPLEPSVKIKYSE